MKKLSFLLLILAVIASTQIAKATHYMGGEITWECIPTGQPNAGKFIFTMKVYRECYTSNGSAAAQFGTSNTILSNSPAGNFSVSEISGWPKDISPVCNSNPLFSHITCTGMATGAGNMGAVQEHIYRSAPITINGIPPASGWTFSWSSSARNPSTNVVGQPGWYLRAKMFPYQNTNTYPCFDNSPTFAEVPRTVICTGYPFTYNHNGYDKELDALTFEWGLPMITATNPVTYTMGYSYTNPLPGPTQNANNVAAVVNANTGTISFTSYTTGAYVTSTKVSAYRCGVKVAEIWRDMQVVLLACGTNGPPTVIPPFAGNTSYSTTVYAGELVTFSLDAEDFQYLPNSMPQTLTLTASGSQLGSFVPPGPSTLATLSTTNGCLNAPCATLTPAPGPGYPLSAMFGVSTGFSWQTMCSHLAGIQGCGATSNVYTFVLKVTDDYCPAPAIAISVIDITVLPKPTIPSPNIQCLKVLPSGDVQIDWSAVTDTMSTFDSYRVFTSNSAAGPFIEIDSIFNINAMTYTHVGANANNNAVYYTLVCKSGCPGLQSNAPADTFSTININVYNNVVGGTADLNWNATISPLLNSSTGWYKIYREYPPGVWEFVDSTQNLSYIDTITICNDTVAYRVEIEDTLLIDGNGIISSCSSVSNTDKDLFADIIAPNIPVLDSVSVNPNTHFVEISWDENSAGDTEGYVIYLMINGVGTTVDTVWGISNYTFEDQLNNPCNPDGSYLTYAIAAFDSCGKISPISVEHNTMNITAVKDICDDKMTLTWNSYHNMPGGLQSYELYASENGGPEVLLTSAAPLDTVFEHVGLTNNSEYCYYVRAVGTTGATSTSCVICEMANKPNQPQFVYIRSASVIPGNKFGVELTIHTDTTAKVSLYRIERSSDASNWTSIATLPPNYTNPTLSYIDGAALVSTKSYYYRVIVIDSCGFEAITSKQARTILLKVIPSDSLFNNLSWNAYQEFDGTPTTYQVYRSLDGIWESAPMITLPSSQLNFQDNVAAYKDQGGIFEYFVSALEGSFNQWSFEDSARSNSVVAVQKPRLYVPSAFNPNSSVSENRTFYPQGVFINSKDYLFTVYNRWGEKVFETTQINVGWDGTFKGIEATQDVYTYYVRFTSASGILFEDRGTVTLIR